MNGQLTKIHDTGYVYDTKYLSSLGYSGPHTLTLGQTVFKYPTITLPASIS